MLAMAVDEATEVLIILIVIIAVILIFLIVVIVLFVLRWRRNQLNSLTYSYGNPSRYRSWPSTRHSKQERGSSLYAYASPTDVIDLTELSERDIDNDKRFEIEEGETNLYDLPRISAISGTSVDIGDIGDVSTFVREPRVVQARHQQTDRDRVDGKVDSMRSSAGVDLGANYNKARNIISRPQRFDL